MSAPLLAIPVGSIEIPEYRQRTSLDKDKILELGESFKKGRQIHPIALRREGEKWILVAGFRRLSARKILVPNMSLRCGQLSLEAGQIAATDWGEMNEIEREEVELEENTARVDLTFPEKAAAIAKLHAMRTAQALAKGQTYSNFTLMEEGRVSPDSNNITFRVRETATLLELSKHLESDPNALKVKTLSEARAFLQKKAQVTQNAKLRAAFEAASEKGTDNRVLLGSSYDQAIIAQLPAGQFDVALLDPPYGIGADSFGTQGGVTPGTAGHAYGDSAEAFGEVCNRVPGILAGLLKPDAHVYCFCDPRGYEKLKSAFQFEGFDVWHVPLIWVKNRGILPDPKRGPRRTYEMILFAYRGERFVEIVANDVLSHPAVQTPRHGAEKPVSLLVDLLMRSVRPGSLVIDLFAGSGSIFPAATATHCIAWGVEREQQYYDLAVTRLTERWETAAGPEPSGDAGEAPEKLRSPLEDL